MNMMYKDEDYVERWSHGKYVDVINSKKSQIIMLNCAFMYYLTHLRISSAMANNTY